MKNTNSKSIKESQPTANKRSMSPLIGYAQQPPQNVSNNKSNKKKPIQNSPYHKAMKDFESYGKGERKKIIQSRVLDSNDKHNKFRIVTEPVDDRIMHLGQSNIFNSSLALRNPNSRKKIDTEVHESTRQIRLNIRDTNSKSRSRERMYSNTNNARTDQKCPNCAKFAEQLDYLNSKIRKMVKQKNLWKIGDLTLEQMKEIFDKKRASSPNKMIRRDQYKFADGILLEIKTGFAEMMKDIEALSSIDYPKMLSMDIFTYEHSYPEYLDAQESELKDLLGQLRASVEGKTIEYDTYDSDSDNPYTKMILRNLKSRLGSCLRQNLELKIRKSILEKAEQISEESEGYLRKVIEDVLESYHHKM